MAGSGGTVKSVAVANGVVVDTSDTYGSVAFRGYSLRATTAGIINIRVGGATGLILATIDRVATAGSGAVDELYPDEVDCQGDLYCEIVSGVWVGSIRYG